VSGLFTVPNFGILLMDELFLTERELSNHLNVPRRTAQRWRTTGDGPPFVRLGQRRVAYRLSDVERWAAARTFTSRAAEVTRRSAAE
jgi:predicted DNA-binding transcriptional regulator AlpA